MTYPVPSSSSDAGSAEAVVDLRSDTVTRPSPGMLAAMMAAPVGDDVWGDDPTVNRLQAVTADRAGKEAGLFFPSGTQSNLAALMSHCARGEEFIVGQRAHTYRYEAGGAAVLGSIQPQPIENESDGTLPLSKIGGEIKPDDAHFARTRLLALENTINGKVLPAAYVTEAAALARSRGLSLHLDGARAWNAAVASGASVAEVCAPFDSVSLCFSKGLGAPVGSVLVGSRELILRAKRARKILGGGMRQAGILAAGCLYALDHHLDALAEDHATAARLAAGLDQIEDLTVESVATNMLFVRVPEARCAPLQAALAEAGVLAAISPLSRFVLHRDVSAAGVERTLAAVRTCFKA
jgi:threonine aldolase